MGIRFLVTPKRISVSTETNFRFGVSGKQNFVSTGNEIPFLDFIFDVVQPCPLVGLWLLQHATNEDLLVESKLFDYFEDYLLLIYKAAAAVP